MVRTSNIWKMPPSPEKGKRTLFGVFLGVGAFYCVTQVDSQAQWAIMLLSLRSSSHRTAAQQAQPRISTELAALNAITVIALRGRFNGE